MFLNITLYPLISTSVYVILILSIRLANVQRHQRIFSLFRRREYIWLLLLFHASPTHPAVQKPVVTNTVLE